MGSTWQHRIAPQGDQSQNGGVHISISESFLESFFFEICSIKVFPVSISWPRIAPQGDQSQKGISDM